MSWKAQQWARSWSGDLNTSRRFVLYMIADHYNDERRRAWPSAGTLAKETALDRRTVTRCVAELVQSGLIEVERWINVDDGTLLRNRYCLPWFDPQSMPAPRPVLARRTRRVDGTWQEVPVGLAVEALADPVLPQPEEAAARG